MSSSAFSCRRLWLATALAVASAACGPEVGDDSAQGSTGSSTSDLPPDGTTAPGTSSGGPSPGSSEDDDGGDSSSTSTGSAGDQSCEELAQMQWADFGKLSGSTCGDMTIAGVSADQTALLVVSVPPILGTPWDADWQAHALYTLPDPQVVAQVARYAEPLPADTQTCQEGGALPEGAIEIYDIEAELDFSLLNRDEVGCLFTCDTVYAQLLGAAVDCGGEKVLLGAAGDTPAGAILLHGYAELP